jgi:hypothetical protein
MISQMQHFVAGKTQTLNRRIGRLREKSVQSARSTAQGSADFIKGLKTPVRVVARSGVKLAAVSQNAVQELIELQSDALTAAIGEVALRLERASRAGSMIELVRDQVEMIPATRERIAGDAGRAMQVFATAGREVRSVATHAYGRVKDGAAKQAPARTVRRKAKKAAGRGRTRARKTAA